ncbi:hypothetical protein ACGFWI_07475 [Streptomyces sp. NPDC048434]|uniref:hypothetical protein n=1 Tax=Streptomyces sp. NPDC048434 TaxID=3365549 RepID=UPI003714B33E
MNLCVLVAEHVPGAEEHVSSAMIKPGAASAAVAMSTARSDRAAQDVGEQGARELADAPRIDVVAEHEADVVVAPARFLMAALRAYRGCTV